jgi:enoyl-CoA hydratase
MSEELVLQKQEGSITWLRLNRPEAHNALTPALIQALDDAFRTLEEDESVRVVVMSGEGEDFCAGADVGALGAFGSYESRAKFGRRMRRTGLVFSRIEKFPKPVIASVHGRARAGGLELVVCCDLVVAARSAKLGDAHSPHGQLPGGGASVRLPRRIGLNRAKYMLLTGDMVDAATLLDWGLVNEVVEDGELIEATGRLARRLAANSPTSLGHIKRLVNTGLDEPQDAALATEILAAELNLGSSDMAEGMRAISEGRPPVFGRPETEG